MPPIPAPAAIDVPVALRLEGSVFGTPLARVAAGARYTIGPVAALVQWHNHLLTVFCPDLDQGKTFTLRSSYGLSHCVPMKPF